MHPGVCTGQFSSKLWFIPACSAAYTISVRSVHSHVHQQVCVLQVCAGGCVQDVCLMHTKHRKKKKAMWICAHLYVRVCTVHVNVFLAVNRKRERSWPPFWIRTAVRSNVRSGRSNESPQSRLTKRHSKILGLLREWKSSAVKERKRVVNHC